jgi:hypothetical protein
MLFQNTRKNEESFKNEMGSTWHINNYRNYNHRVDYIQLSTTALTLRRHRRLAGK